MTPERFNEIKTGVPLSEPTCYTRVIQECINEIERLRTTNARLAAALRQIMYLPQQTGVSFECQSFQAFDIAGNALRSIVEGKGKE